LPSLFASPPSYSTTSGIAIIGTRKGMPMLTCLWKLQVKQFVDGCLQVYVVFYDDLIYVLIYEYTHMLWNA
jgi:hypothetical protein